MTELIEILLRGLAARPLTRVYRDTGMTAICAKETAGVDVKQPSRIVALCASIERGATRYMAARAVCFASARTRISLLHTF